jgi:type II secretory pathway component PulC
MKQNDFPPGWDAERVARVIAHYETQTDDEAVAEDEASFEAPAETVMSVPTELVPAIRELIAKHRAA